MVDMIPPPSRIVLTGFMGAGKTAVGTRVARAFDWPFVDLDAEIVRAEEQSIAAIFESRGEAEFRQIENRALQCALRNDRIVLALGGGTLELDHNRELLFRDPANRLIYLEAPLETLIHRCEQQLRQQPGAPRRPVLENRAELKDRFFRRKLLYDSAHSTINTENRTPEEIASQIVEQLREGAALLYRAEMTRRA